MKIKDNIIDELQEEGEREPIGLRLRRVRAAAHLDQHWLVRKGTHEVVRREGLRWTEPPEEYLDLKKAIQRSLDRGPQSHNLAWVHHAVRLDAQVTAQQLLHAGDKRRTTDQQDDVQIPGFKFGILECLIYRGQRLPKQVVNQRF